MSCVITLQTLPTNNIINGPPKVRFSGIMALCLDLSLEASVNRLFSLSGTFLHKVSSEYMKCRPNGTSRNYRLKAWPLKTRSLDFHSVDLYEPLGPKVRHKHQHQIAVKLPQRLYYVMPDATANQRNAKVTEAVSLCP